MVAPAIAALGPATALRPGGGAGPAIGAPTSVASARAGAGRKDRAGPRVRPTTAPLVAQREEVPRPRGATKAPLKARGVRSRVARLKCNEVAGPGHAVVVPPQEGAPEANGLAGDVGAGPPLAALTGPSPREGRAIKASLCVIPPLALGVIEAPSVIGPLLAPPIAAPLAARREERLVAPSSRPPAPDGPVIPIVGAGGRTP